MVTERTLKKWRREALERLRSSNEIKTVHLKLKEICKNCGCSRGAHNASGYYSGHYEQFIPRDYCPGHEGRMDWGKGPGTVFAPIKETGGEDE